MKIESKYVTVDGIRTHYLETGAGPDVVLLHSGEFGAAAEISWEFTLPALAPHFHLIAPDWLGFGETDKLYDFADPRGRVYRHMQRFVESVGIRVADFIGSSMGASNLVQIAAEQPTLLPIRSIVLSSGGGFVPITPERKTLLGYDGTPATMSAAINAMFHDPKWGYDAGYVARRQHFALMPGAWECASAPRIQLPGTGQSKTSFGKPDSIRYEKIAVPTLIVAGAEDRLREPGYALKLAERIKGSEVHVLERCGHCPNIERADSFNAIVIAFLKKVQAQAGHRRETLHT